MYDYSTLGHNLKREIFRYSEKLTSGLSRPVKKFIFAMIFGILVSKSSFLTQIARKLNEEIALDKTVERLSRNLMNFSNEEIIWENYFNAVKKHFDERTVLLYR
jgi:hypothetical protein